MTLPATTPLLSGTRVRSGQMGLEFVVPNPAGGRGVYILSWAGVKEVWQPSIHDRLLHDALAAAESVTPSTVRRAARTVAAGGAAGREARASAQRAIAADRALHDQALRLLTARAGIQKDADAPGLSERLADLGVGPQAAEARIPLLLARMAALRDETQAWAEANGDGSGVVAALRSVSDLAIRGGARLLTDARALMQDLKFQAATWDKNRAVPGFALNRPDWFLDGWDLPCLLWQHAGTLAEQRAAVQEIYMVLPVMPREAGRWLDMKLPGPGEVEQPKRTVLPNKDWRTGVERLAGMARNEQLRALGG